MRHRKATRNLGRHPDHRRALLRNLVINLLEHGRIRTTVQKAKAARPLAEKLITLGKRGTLLDRRTALRKLGATAIAKAAVRILFEEMKERFANRKGGYTRILHLPRTIRQAKVDLPRSPGIARSKIYGTRLRDNAELVLWELCEAEIKKPERKPRRVRSKKPKAESTAEAPAAEAKTPAEPQPEAERKPVEPQAAAVEAKPEAAPPAQPQT